jgi:hypothetical protein
MDNQNYPWEAEFKALYERTKSQIAKGEKNLDRLFNEGDCAFLQSIGSKPIEMFDSADDATRYGEPSYEDVLEIHRMRYDYFTRVQKGVAISPVEHLRDKSDVLGGIPWLPRAIDKVRAKLAGRLVDNYYYPCSGDRKFLKQIKMAAPDFFRIVRDSSSDEEVLQKIKKV